MPAHRSISFLLASAIALSLPLAAFAAKKKLGFEDLMRFRQIRQVQLSDAGDWVAYALVPDRGDGEGVARATQGRGEWRVERGGSPAIAADGAHSAFRVATPFVEAERAKREKDDAAKPGCALIRHSDGERWDFDAVQSYAFGGDGAWFGVHFEAVPDTSESEDGEAEKDEKAEEARGELVEGWQRPRFVIAQWADEGLHRAEHPADQPDSAAAISCWMASAAARGS